MKLKIIHSVKKSEHKLWLRNRIDSGKKKPDHVIHLTYFLKVYGQKEKMMLGNYFFN